MMLSYPEGPEAVRSMLRRATALQFDDSGSQQFAQRLRGLAGERPERVMRALDHGFSSHPPAGSEGLLAALGGRSDRLVALGFVHKDKRPRDLPEGGVALYDADGKLLKIVKDGTDYDAGGKPVVIRNATKVTIEGNAEIVIGVSSGRYVRIRPGRVDLAVKAPDEDAPLRVATEAGPSGVLWTRLD